MSQTQEPRSIPSHYGRGAVLDSILRALTEAGKDLQRLVPADLAPVDEFHVRGRQATVELAERAALRSGERVLDVGCGLGGSARYLATEHGARVVGVDLTRESVDAAEVLARLTGLAGQVEFREADARALPFADASFDVVWTEHVQMNIADKRVFYSGLARVLAPGGRLVFHDIFQGEGGAPLFPVPWAEDSRMSFLAPQSQVHAILDELGFAIAIWQDLSPPVQAWFESVEKKLESEGPPPLGIHLLMGETASAKVRNLARNFREGRVCAVQAVCVLR